MKAFCATYNKTKKGLLLRINWVETMGEDYIEEFLSKFINNIPEVEVIGKKVRNELDTMGYSSNIEGKMEMDDVVIHIIFSK